MKTYELTGKHMDNMLTETTGYDLEVGDIVKVTFTDSYCEVVSKNFKYGRTSIGLSYYDSISQNDTFTSIAGHTKVLKKQNV